MTSTHVGPRPSAGGELGSQPVSEPVSVAIMNDYPVVVSGVQQMLAPYADRVRVVELVSLLPVVSSVDVLLFDAFGRDQLRDSIERVIEETDARVVIYTWRMHADLAREAQELGAAGCVSKALPPEELVAALERVQSGAGFVEVGLGKETKPAGQEWPGKEHGLSRRESEVLALVAQGLSNQEIADSAFIGLNSVKTYIRSAYRKIGVQRRTQALLWATRHGFVPERRRILVEPAGDPSGV